MKRGFLLTAIFSYLLVASLCLADDNRPVARPGPAQQSAAPVPPTPEQMPASPPRVSFRDGQLMIVANNSSMGDILRAVHAQTGATIDIPGNPTDRVFGQFGPGPARDVLASLLNGSHFNYILLGSATSPDELQRVILTAKSGGPATAPNPETQTTAYYQPPQPSVPGPAIRAAIPSNTVVSQPEDPADGQDDSATDDSADAQDDTTADDQSDQTDDSTQSDDQQTDQGDQSAAADDGQQQQNGQPAVKTPEQMLQELQQRQQQIMQQQQGLPPGTPAPPGLIPGQMPPH